MKQYFWILLIKILVLESDVFKANAVSSEDFLQPPNDVRLNSIDTSTLQLRWSPPNATNETLTGYKITWDVNGTFVGNSSTAFNITNLPTPGRNYTASISAYYATQQNSLYINVSKNTFPSPPYNLIVTSRGTNSLTISFDKDGQWDSCYAWADNATGSSGSCPSAGETATITSLPMAGSEYTIHIVAQSGSFNSSIATTMQRTNPLPASNITVVSRQINRFDLNWTNEGVLDNCFVWVEEAPSVATSCFTGTKTAVIANLPTPGKQYTIHMVIQSGQLNSTTSNITERTSPTNPGSLYCSSRTTTTLTIGIGFPSGSSYELDGYLFSISSKIPLFSYSVNRTVNANTAQPNVTFMATNMTAGVTYSITAKTTIQNLFSSGQSITECTTDLNAPGNVHINNTSEMAVQIIWDASQGNFDGFKAFCDGQNQAIDVNSVLYLSPGPGNTMFSTVCNNMTAGALYNISVSTFLNQTTLTSMKSSNPVWIVTVPQPPKTVTASPIDTNSIQMQLLYGYNVDVSQCTFYEILYSNRTDFIACGTTSVNYSLPFLESDSLYNINTFALSNYSASLSSISRNSVQTRAWTLAPPVTNIIGNESLPWSLEVIIIHQPFPRNVWQYVIRVTNSTHLVQRVHITCSDANKTALTAVNCAWNSASLVLNSTATCSAGFNYNITELRPYTNYNISVQAVNPGGCSQAKSIVLSTNESSE